MNKAIALFALIAIASAAFPFRIDTQNTLWGTWKLAHNKQYSVAEDAHRLEIFLQNTEKIAKLNPLRTEDINIEIRKISIFGLEKRDNPYLQIKMDSL